MGQFLEEKKKGGLVLIGKLKKKMRRMVYQEILLI